MGSALQTLRGNDLLADDQRQLVSEVLAKDRKATAEFVEYCAGCVYPFVRRHMMPRQEWIEDLTQETLLAAWRTLPQFRGESSLKTWVLGIARHKVEDHYRKRIREVEISEDEESAPEVVVMPRFQEGLEAAERCEQVQRTLSEMPEA